MITADTITDEQLRELREYERRQYARTRDPEAFKRLSEANIALDPHYTDRARGIARARCAEILNARRSA